MHHAHTSCTCDLVKAFVYLPMAVGILYFLHTLWLVVRRARAADLASCVHVLAQASHRWKARHYTLSRLSSTPVWRRPRTCPPSYARATRHPQATCHVNAMHMYMPQLLIILLVVPPLVHVKILGPCEQCYSFSAVAVHAAGTVLHPFPRYHHLLTPPSPCLRPRAWLR